MNFPHGTRSWRWLFRACLVALLLGTSATSGFAQTLSEKREGEAPAEPRTTGTHGSAGASPSRNPDSPITSPTRASIPLAEQQKENAKLLEEIHKLSRLKTAPEKQDVVKKLMVSSRNKSLTPDQRYGVLTTVIPLAKEVSDFESWLEAVNALVTEFEVDANKEKTRLLIEFLEARKAGELLKPAAVEEALAIARVAASEIGMPRRTHY